MATALARLSVALMFGLWVGMGLARLAPPNSQFLAYDDDFDVGLLDLRTGIATTIVTPEINESAVRNIGERLFYVRNTHIGTAEIFMTTLFADEPPQQLTENAYTFTSYDINGDWLAYTGITPGDGPWSDIYITHMPTGETHQLTSTARISERGPVWSPDASRVAYRQYNGSGEKVVVYTLEDGPRTLAGVGGQIFQMSWSPDGETLAVVRTLGMGGPRANMLLLPIPRSPVSRLSMWGWMPPADPPADGNQPLFMDSEFTAYGGVAWGADGETLIVGALSTRTLRRELFRVGVGGEMMQAMPTNYDIEHRARLRWVEGTQTLTYINRHDERCTLDTLIGRQRCYD